MNKRDAKNKIRKHLANRSDQKVTVTPATVRYWWKVLNVAIFSSKLQHPDQIICKNFKQHYGWCDHQHDQSITIGIFRQMPTRRLMLATIAHEMVHQWQIENGYNNAHNKHFFKWKQPLQKLGLPLRVWIDDEREYRIHG